MFSADRLGVLLVVVLLSGTVAGPAAASSADTETPPPDAHFEASRADNSGYGSTTLVVDAPADEAVYVESPAFDDEALEEMFGGTIEGDLVRVPLPPSGEIDVEACTPKTGEVTFTVTGADSGVSDTANLTLYRLETPNFHHRDTVMVTEPNETARIQVENDLGDCTVDSTQARIVVGSREAGTDADSVPHSDAYADPRTDGDTGVITDLDPRRTEQSPGGEPSEKGTDEPATGPGFGPVAAVVGTAPAALAAARRA